VSTIDKSFILKDKPLAQKLAKTDLENVNVRVRVASQVMQGIAAGWDYHIKWDPEAVAARALDCADWLLVKLTGEK
jgi:hypothetical protein